MKRRILTILCMIALLAGIFTIGAAAADTTPVCIVLSENISDLNITEDTYYDLNGHDITGTVTVAPGCTLYCMDSQTDDYTINDEYSYGKITGTINGKVEPVPAGSAVSADLGDQDYRAGYLMITAEGDTGVSFHRVNLQLHTVTLNPAKVGIMYKCQFSGDEAVEANVAEYGVAVSTQVVPEADNLGKCARSELYARQGFNSGKNGNAGTSTVLTNIMKSTQGYQTNKANAETPVNGRAYIKTSSNEYIFGENQSWSLMQIMNEVNNSAVWDTQVASNPEILDSIMSMYHNYTSVMNNWDIPKIKEVIELEANKPLSDGKTLKLLAITSSFGRNTTDMLYDIAVAEGCTDVVVGRLYASGCTLKAHVSNVKNNTAAYQYTKISTDSGGEWSTEEDTTMLKGIKDEDWDVIFIQQSASESPRIETYGNYINELMIYVDAYKTNPYAHFVWNMTWAYQSDSTQWVFADYFNGDQEYMYETIVDVVKKKIEPRTDFTAIIPSGTAIQNARTSYFGDTLCRDTYHLNNLGKAIVGYTLYSVLTGEELTEINLGPVNSYDIKDDYLTLSEDDKAVIIEAVNAAIKNPYEVTRSTHTEQ